MKKVQSDLFISYIVLTTKSFVLSSEKRKPE